MSLDPIVMGVIIVVGLVAARLMWLGLRPSNGVHDEPPTLDTRGADPNDPTAGTH